jgi:hypothetical protein
MHFDLDNFGEEFYQETKRRTYLTPSHYLDILQLFLKMYKAEKTSLPLKIKKYEEGLKKMRETEVTIVEL